MALFRKSTGMGPAPLDGVDVVLADLDGVVYRGPNPVPHAVESLNALAPAGIRSGYITNNASRTDEQVAQHLRDLGLSLTAEDVVTSPQAAVGLLSTKVAPGSLILVVGGDAHGGVARSDVDGIRHGSVSLRRRASWRPCGSSAWTSGRSR